MPKRSVIGIGAGAHYTLYDPATDRIESRSVAATAAPNAATTKRRGLGFA